MNDISYSVVSSGSSTFMRSFSIPLAEELELTEGMKYKKTPEIEIFKLDKRVSAVDASVVGIVGILLVIPGWFGVKILDEIYDIKIKPIVRSIILKADSVHLFSSEKKYKIFTIEIFKEEGSVLIMFAAKEKSLKDWEYSIKGLPKLLPNAMQYIKDNISKDEVHVYVLSSGKVNIQPHIFDNRGLAQKWLNT